MIWLQQHKTQQNRVHILWDILKIENRYDANFAITGVTAACHNDLWCRQSRQSRHHGNSVFGDSVQW